MEIKFYGVCALISVDIYQICRVLSIFQKKTDKFCCRTNNVSSFIVRVKQHY